MRWVFIFVVCSFLAGCGAVDKAKAYVTGAASKTCVDGITYLQFTSGAAVQVDVNGKPVACK